MSPRLRPLLLLPVLATLVAAAVLWGGVRLSQRERIERVLPEDDTTGRYAGEMAEAIRPLEALYQQHLDILCRRHFGNTFELKGRADSLVGIRQVSTLSSNGQVNLVHLADSARSAESELPVPVLDPKALPFRRTRPFVVAAPALPGGGEAGGSGWIGAGDALFFFRHLSSRSTAFILVDRAEVRAAIGRGLAGQFAAMPKAPEGGSVAVSTAGRVVAGTEAMDGESPDLVHRIGSRFGDWEVRSRDPRVRLVEHDPGLLAASVLLAFAVALGGGIAFVHLHRALRLAEQRVSFVNQVSHELKTPLTNILLNADLASDGVDASGRKRLGMVQEEARRLSRLIDNVLAFSRKASAARTPTPPLALRPAVERVVETFRPALERRGVVVHIEGEDAAALADPDAFAQILGNLLSNVEKYAASGRLVRILVEARGDGTAVQVRDAGPGIPRRERERVFLPFHRLDDRTAEGASGTGLGLSIARDLAEGMGGSLRLLPAGPEPGCVFELLLPAAADAKVIAFPESRAS